jgi:hypothetical protein
VVDGRGVVVGIVSAAMVDPSEGNRVTPLHVAAGSVGAAALVKKWSAAPASVPGTC